MRSTNLDSEGLPKPRPTTSWRPFVLAIVAGGLLYAILLVGAHVSPGAAFGFLCVALYVGPLSLSLIDDYLGGKRLQALREHELGLTAETLTQRRPDGSLVEIDLRRRFSYQYLYKSDDGAVYRLRQDDAVLDFPSTDPLAEEVVQNVLHLQWPPRGFRGVSA